MIKLKELSVFFPLYNEEKNIEPLVEEALKAFPKVAEKFEILLINDGSTDKTESIGKKLEGKYKEVKLVTQKNKGYGGAIKRGFTESKYEWVFFSDGDLQFDLFEINKFISQIDRKTDLIIGYRKKRAEGLRRNIISKALKAWNKIFLNFPLFIKDVDCAFKLIRKGVIKEVGELNSDGGFVTTEFLLKAHKRGFKFKQIGVTHKKRKFGTPTGSNPKVIIKAIKETFELRKLLGKNDTLNILSLGIFLVFLPLANSINYLQNDEYTNYQVIQNFLNGNFTLDPYIGATFYLQGFLGSIWSKIFGTEKLEILTLLVSVLTFYFLVKTLNEHLKLKTLDSILIGSLVLLNPIFVYSSFGFMTENYFLLFLSLSIYFIGKFDDNKKPKDFILANLFIVSGYFIRQVSLVSSIALVMYLIFTKRYKYVLYQTLIFIGLVIFHYNIFPITPQMYDQNLSFITLGSKDRSISLFYILLIYISAFTAPLIITVLKRRSSFLVILLSIPIFLTLNSNFRPEKIDFIKRTVTGETQISYAVGEFPYLDNIFGRKGFLQEDIVGDKYHYPGNFDLFTYWDIVSRALSAILISIIILNIKKSINFYSIFTAGYILLLLISPKVYDRYLLPTIMAAVLLLSSFIKKLRKTDKFVISVFLLFFIALDYLYLSDFYYVNTYVWNEAEKIVSETNESRNNINVNHSWRMLHPCKSKTRCYNYVFKYDPIEKQPEDLGYLEIIKEHTVKFPLNIYINPKIYTYKRIVPIELDKR